MSQNSKNSTQSASHIVNHGVIASGTWIHKTLHFSMCT